MVEVKLYGELRRRFGHSHRFDIRSPAEAIRALIANFPDFEAHMAGAHERGVGYKVFVADQPLSSIDEVANPSGQSTIKISPRLLGAKSESMQILLGIALIVVAWWNPGAWGFAASGLWSAQTIGAIGFSLVLGGVAQMLAPQPKGLDMKEAPGNSPSYLFNGPVNTSAQGHCVPVGYGRLIVGSSVISAGVIAEDIPI